MQLSRGMRYRVASAAAVALVVTAVAGAGEPSRSKLSVHLIGSYSSSTETVISGRPRVLKILDTHGTMMSAARAYKAAVPDGVVVLRVYTTRKYTLVNDPVASAEDFALTVLLPAVSGLSAADRGLIDYIEGPNEGDSTPSWGSSAESVWFNDFWVALAPLIADAGFKPCAFSIPVGNPPGTLSGIHQHLDNIAPALRVCRSLGGAWSYHAYTPNYSTATSFEMWYSLRYRIFYSHFANRHRDLLELPIILTEGGFDTGGNPHTSGWQANGTAGDYTDWLTWFDGQLRQDDQVLGVTLFQMGSPSTWPSFECEPIALWLRSHLLAAAPTVIQAFPGQLYWEVEEGQTLPVQTLEIGNSNPAAGAMNYALSDDMSWLSLNPVSGSVADELDAIAVQVQTVGVAAGVYSGSITILAASAENSPKLVPVTLNVVRTLLPGDLDGDRHLTGADVRLFLPCMSGEGKASGQSCVLTDLDGDGDTDLADFGRLQRCLSGYDTLPPADCGG